MTKIMKDSGINWVREIPSDWKIKRVKEIAFWNVGFTPSTNDLSNYNGNEFWCTISDINNKNISETKLKISSKFNFKNYKSKKGDLLFSFKLSIGKVGFLTKDMFTNEAICSFSKKSKINLNFLYYTAPLFISKSAKKNIYNADLLNQKLIKNCLIVYPPLETQKQIADFLDLETSRIDSEIEKLTKQNILLEELKNSLIFEAVTGKIDISVEGEKYSNIIENI